MIDECNIFLYFTDSFLKNMKGTGLFTIQKLIIIISFKCDMKVVVRFILNQSNFKKYFL